MSKKKEPTIYRQGDVLLIREDLEPKGDPVAKEDVVLAYGEVTGHAHRVRSPDAALFDIAGELDKLLRCGKVATLTHEEHSPIKLPAGTYRVRRQREYSPEVLRQVAD